MSAIAIGVRMSPFRFLALLCDVMLPVGLFGSSIDLLSQVRFRPLPGTLPAPGRISMSVSAYHRCVS